MWSKYRTWCEKVDVQSALADIHFQFHYPEVVQAIWALHYHVETDPKAPSRPWQHWLKSASAVDGKDGKKDAKDVKDAAHPLPSPLRLRVLPSEMALAARVYRWHAYLAPFRHRIREWPTMEGAIHQQALFMRKKMEAYVQAPQLDPFYNLGRELVNKASMRLGGEAWHGQHHPREKGFTNTTDYLNLDLVLAEKELLNDELRYHPKEHWDKMAAWTKEMWLLTAYIYAFDVCTTAMAFPMPWQDHFMIGWWEWGTPAADLKFKCQVKMDMRPRPLLCMWGQSEWSVHPRPWTSPKESKEESKEENAQASHSFPIRTLDVVEALAQWQYWVMRDFQGLLENGSPVPQVFSLLTG